MSAATFALPAQVRPRSATNHAVLIFAAVAAMALSARMNLPLIPVPITAQTLAVLLIGVLLGPTRGTLSMLIYLAVGVAGSPVFAAGGGVAYLSSPTWGYLVGFVPAVWLVGTLIGRGDRFRPLATAATFTLATVVIFAVGLAWLSLYVPSPTKLLMVGLVPFLPGAALKIAIACLVTARLRK